jgi:hypothetical protein
VDLRWATAPIARARQRAPVGEVVDVQAREVDRPPRR